MEWGLGGGGWALMPPRQSGKFLIKIVDHYKCVRHGNVPFTKNVQSRLICPTGFLYVFQGALHQFQIAQYIIWCLHFQPDETQSNDYISSPL